MRPASINPRAIVIRIGRHDGAACKALDRSPRRECVGTLMRRPVTSTSIFIFMATVPEESALVTQLTSKRCAVGTPWR